ncbi:Alpha/Beta hydrolase protein [Talaromyces proteolyticus]|uniref:Alpha/Beta hydrolase protein n=1 Tax=Talaromyces proteolyticus TaxID=1131652 RepID=A0AAD4L390_9EURO|nr:Alpha/Beta hydrolase protein [Talaromyces proteolyticus]KAH8705786.1 Alpha/Beta hydrolase protein [Talaromyces proteolyticus]
MASVNYVFKAVKYGAQKVNLTATVHLPKDTSSVKGIALYFHGGGYVVGSRAMLPAAHIDALNEGGFVAVSSDYRLSPTISVLDGPVADSVAAYEWAQDELPVLLEREHDIRVNGKNIVTLGHSCGGGLALLMASRAHPPKAILDLFGFKYLRDPFYHTGSRTILPPGTPPLPSAEFIERVFEETPPPTAALPPFGPNGLDLCTPRQAYLITSVGKGTQFDKIIAEDEYDYVDPEKLLKRPDFPPTFFVQGTADVVVDAKFAQWAHAELHKNGVQAKLYLVEGGTHGFDARLNRDDAAFEPIQKGIDFLAYHVGVGVGK